LAGIVGHELNNIAVPLEGFAELALQNVRASESVGPILDEIKIAVARIKSLASELESLGDTGSRVGPVAIGDCMPNESGADPVETEIDWRCSASTVVAADPVHARRGLQALISITGRTGSHSASPAALSVAQEAPGARARCAACGAAPPRKDHVVVQAFSSRAVSGEALREPFGSARAGRASRRLALAVFVHSAHRAGGHIFLDEDAGSLSVAFPTA
jgi:hypothetical protein